MSEPNIVEEFLSDDKERSSTPDLPCSVCLDEITNPSHPNSCLHSFCFECIQQWSKVSLVQL